MLIYSICICWIPDGSQRGSIKQGFFFLLSFFQSFRLSRCFHGIWLILFLRYSPKSPYFSKTNQWNSLIFCMLIQIHKNGKLIKNVLLSMVKSWCAQSGLGTENEWKCFGWALSKIDMVSLVTGIKDWIYMKNELMK